MLDQPRSPHDTTCSARLSERRIGTSPHSPDGTLSREMTRHEPVRPHSNAHSAERAPAELLVVDDNAFDRQHLASLIARAGPATYRAVFAATLEQAGRAVARHAPHLVLLDDLMVRENGARVTAEDSLAEIRRCGYAGPVAIVSGIKRPGRPESLVRAGVIDFVCKDGLSCERIVLLAEMAEAFGHCLRRS